jgi:hypothetical protein
MKKLGAEFFRIFGSVLESCGCVVLLPAFLGAVTK